ncbi:MAG: hypothetical protein M1830_000105 [Pleopsidium flavum]|nr:MAG: hypothetical protein M1830_000105 [Pleopsidium flavum]
MKQNETLLYFAADALTQQPAPSPAAQVPTINDESRIHLREVYELVEVRLAVLCSKKGETTTVLNNASVAALDIKADQFASTFGASEEVEDQDWQPKKYLILDAFAEGYSDQVWSSDDEPSILQDWMVPDLDIPLGGDMFQGWQEDAERVVLEQRLHEEKEERQYQVAKKDQAAARKAAKAAKKSEEGEEGSGVDNKREGAEEESEERSGVKNKSEDAEEESGGRD